MKKMVVSAWSLASGTLGLLLLSGGLSYSPSHRRDDTGSHGVSRRICSSPISFVLRSARDNNDENNNDAIALNEIRQRLAEITESLEQARKQEEEIRLDNNLLQGRRDGTIVETENIVTSIKRGYA
jgi:hypothetical protein